MEIELWQVPLLVMAVLVAGYFAYVAMDNHWSDRVKLWFKVSALGILAAVGLGIGYQLLQRAELSVLSTLLAFLMLVVEGIIAWVGWAQLKALREHKEGGPASREAPRVDAHENGPAQ